MHTFSFSKQIVEKLAQSSLQTKQCSHPRCEAPAWHTSLQLGLVSRAGEEGIRSVTQSLCLPFGHISVTRVHQGGGEKQAPQTL